MSKRTGVTKDSAVDAQTQLQAEREAVVPDEIFQLTSDEINKRAKLLENETKILRSEHISKHFDIDSLQKKLKRIMINCN
ncbi:hypothetical protein DLAC_11839 [Tieghemostelium lacteum]|uniref:Uncharacterized protein n=1 Tax=Tieghemostelium lacteum TaxID=361077 RepID=A0A151Z332_TIELA|nr:hypothetical protein DLAC_11839 [Tieghemostelium lacteum]|eukprot:KYQ88359.1 hypothetical protein DLAC_11839 [Tieghemostelium lacteum]